MTAKRLLLLVSLLALVFSATVRVTAQSNAYFVATNGSDSSPGTIGAPWSTLRYAVSQLHAGDTLYIRGGMYTGGLNIIDSTFGPVPSGTSWSSPITIAGYASEAVTLQPPDGLKQIRLTDGQSFIVFQDFTIDMSNETDHATGADAEAVYISSGTNHIRFLRLEVRNSVNSAFTFSDNNGNSPFMEVISCNIHGNGRGVDAGGNGSGYAVYGFTSDNLFEKNDIHDNGSYGLHLVTETVNRNVNRNVIRKNHIHHNSAVHIGTSFGIVIGSAASANASDANWIYDNIIDNNEGGILIYNDSNTNVYNNTVYNNTVQGGSEGIALQYYNVSTIRNNIVFNNPRNIFDYGDINNHVTATQDHNLSTDPSFVNAGASDFHLTAASTTAIGQGMTLTAVADDYAGTSRLGVANDIGAYARLAGSQLRAPTNLHVVAGGSQ